ncbi:ATP-binding protein [Anaerobiospirillum succiniciproducens]|uniref:ATP-binding protein n=1 Tax=Anaerobiospirillum succiniciproducens TaxID=13335 RepID=UPI003F8B0BA7
MQESLDAIGLNKYGAQLDNLLISIASLKLSHEDIIQQVLSHFAKIKREFSVTNLYVGAGFPLGLARESYNLSLCQAEQDLVRDLLSTRWLHKGLFLLMHGGPGLGKTLLSIHLGKLAWAKGYSILFLNARATSSFGIKSTKNSMPNSLE